MKKFNLTNREIDAINLFISENVSLPIVEAIYLLACKTRIFEEEKIDIVTVYNTSMADNSLLADNALARTSTLEYEKLQDNIDKYQELCKNSRLSFLTQDSREFVPFIFSARERIAKRELASSTILFDRFGNLRKKQSDAQHELGVSCDVKITNINEIIQGEKAFEKVLKTTAK